MSAATQTIKWNIQVGKAWINTLRSCLITPNAVIIEIAPGTTTKIGQALSMMFANFSGTIYLIDPVCAREVSELYERLLPSATVIPIESTLADAIKTNTCLINLKPDIILCNHGLDDLIVGEACLLARGQITDLTNFFRNHYPEEQQARDAAARTAKVWQKLVMPNITRIRVNVRDELANFILTVAPTVVAISTYESYFFKSWTGTFPVLWQAYKQAKITSAMLGRKLTPHYVYTSAPSSKIIQQSDMWIMRRRTLSKL